MTYRIMGDSTTMANIPQAVDIACIYDDGHLGTFPPADFAAHFPHDRYGWCHIDVTGARPQASVRDWETGDKGGSLEQWVIDHNKASGTKDAVVYCDRSTIPEVRQLTGSQILGADYWLWVSTLDATLYGPWDYPHVIACQALGAAQLGSAFDLSVVFDDRFFRAASVPASPQAQAREALGVLQKYVG